MSNSKFNCLIISPDPEAAKVYGEELAKSSSVGFMYTLSSYPGETALAGLLRRHTFDLLVIDCRDLTSALAVVESVQVQNLQLETLAVCEEDVKVLAALMRAGVRDYIVFDTPIDTLRWILASTIDKLQGKPRRTSTRGEIVAFLPSKPGSGASTIAAHTSLAASRTNKSRVLLVDMDRDAPMQAFLNKLRPDHYLQEALANTEKLDDDLWLQLISQRDRLDILPADADGSAYPDNGHMQQLLSYCRSAYDITCVDLPGPTDSGAVEVLIEAKRIYLVCTQELVSVHIAMRKADRLKRLGLERESCLVVNRFMANHVMNEETIADLVGLPVETTVPNSYALASVSADKGSEVDPTTPLGKSYAKLAGILLNDNVEIPRKERKFLEFISQPFARRNVRSA
ncbi:hypothetical protein [uncultured Paludibaculum sp.]|uniref:hypothetical protein n=1 Tax=uncultured Paludibaculum sp. TaxID=1765020 RepID=UPI002AABAFC7|nr:hypothetical protein [uncultured Paludibaculum sp.]